MNKFFNKIKTKVLDDQTIGPLNDPKIATYLNKPLSSGTYLLHLAVAYGNVSNVKVLLEAGADPTLVDDIKNSPLYYAKSRDIIELLLQHKADINTKNIVGRSFLDKMISYDDYELLKYLLNKNLIESENVARKLGIEQSASTKMILNSFYHKIKEKHVDGETDDDDDSDYDDDSDECQ